MSAPPPRPLAFPDDLMDGFYGNDWKNHPSWERLKIADKASPHQLSFEKNVGQHKDIFEKLMKQLAGPATEHTLPVQKLLQWLSDIMFSELKPAGSVVAPLVFNAYIIEGDDLPPGSDSNPVVPTFGVPYTSHRRLQCRLSADEKSFDVQVAQRLVVPTMLDNPSNYMSSAETIDASYGGRLATDEVFEILGRNQMIQYPRAMSGDGASVCSSGPELDGKTSESTSSTAGSIEGMDMGYWNEKMSFERASVLHYGSVGTGNTSNGTGCFSSLAASLRRARSSFCSADTNEGYIKI